MGIRKGSGEEFARFTASNGTELVIEDDGHHDEDVRVTVLDADGNEVSRDLSHRFAAFRRQVGDDDEITALLAGESDDTGGPASSGDGESLPPAAWVCDDCNRTWPRSKYGEVDGKAVCPGCRDG